MSRSDIDDFAGKTNFDNKLKNLNEKTASNKTKHLKTEKKLTKNIMI